jgi:hypothetical protein
VLLPWAAAWLGSVDAASALVGCETPSGKLKLRPEACKAEREQLAFDAGADPAGVWRWTAGPPAEGSDDSFLEYLVLAADGSGRLHRRQRASGSLDCRDLAYARSLSGTLTVDAHGSGAEVWTGRLPAPDALELTDAGGATTRFERASAVDPAFECVELAEDRRVTGLPAPSSFTGLAFDGTQLWYTAFDGERVQPVDAGTGVPGTPLDIGAPFNELHAMQAGDFWTHCACGNVGETWRVTPAGAFVDEVRPGPGFGEELSLGAIARDEVASVLWLYGYSFAAQTRRLLQVQSDAEPDVLLSSLDVRFYVRALTWDGAALWGLNGPSLFRIDPVTGLVTGTYHLPDESVDWMGVAAANGSLFVIGRSAGDGVLVTVTP